MGQPDRIGARLSGRYTVQRMIGRGAMADVYQATDDEGGLVAVKILHTSLARNNDAVRRFEREAKVQAMVRHRNVAALLDSGITPRGEPFLVVELLRGKSLRNIIKTEGRVTWQRAASYVWQALRGLAAVHARGIIHRDLKPANLMLEPSPGPVERVVLIDFGFAALEGASKLTQAGHVVGSLTYLPPERLHGETGDERSDLYAMGIILFELLAGAPPFVGADDHELIQLHLSAPPPRLTEIAAGIAVPAALEEILVQTLEKEPDHRFASAEEMARAVEMAIRGSQ